MAKQITVNTDATNGGPHSYSPPTSKGYTHHLIVQSVDANTGQVYVSRSDDVATGGPGYEISAGEDVEFWDIHTVYLTADGDGQDVRIERLA